MDLTVLKVKIFMGVLSDALVAEKIVIERDRHTGVSSFTTLENSHLLELTVYKFVFIISVLVNFFIFGIEIYHFTVRKYLFFCEIIFRKGTW